MPVRNGHDRIATALDSLLAQTCASLNVINDDASCDDTAAVVRDKTRSVGRDVTFHSHQTRLGMGTNFRFVLDKADSGYFFWAAQDDL